jgi:ribonuclease HI
MKSIVKADKLKILYEGLVLSRLRYGADCWWSRAREQDLDKLRSIHYRGCSIITGCVPSSHTASVIYEAGFRTLDEEIRDDIVKLADRLRRMSDGCTSATEPEMCFGPEWVVRLFRDRPMPTAALRIVVRGDGVPVDRARPPAMFPPPGFRRDDDRPMSLRAIGRRMRHDDPNHGGPGYDARQGDFSLRPLPTVMPYPPHELAVFDRHVTFTVSPPGDLTRPKEEVEQWPPEVRKQFADANEARMTALASRHGAHAIYAFTDGARQEKVGELHDEACAGAYVICRGQDPRVSENRLLRGDVAVSPLACVYAAEVASLSAALRAALDNFDRVFGNVPEQERHLVIVTDSKSALDSMRCTFVRRLQFAEQTACRLLFDLATRGVHIELAFVFSHVGGVPGNEYADELARDARDRVGNKWPSTDKRRVRVEPLWHIDTTRRINSLQHKRVDFTAGQREDTELLAFRFRSMPRTLRRAPSTALPRDIPRYEEIGLFRARLGMMTKIGGAFHDVLEDCPLCGEIGALGRDGATLMHVVNCFAKHTDLPQLRIDDLWLSPSKAAETVRLYQEYAEKALPAPRQNGVVVDTDSNNDLRAHRRA